MQQDFGKPEYLEEPYIWTEEDIAQMNAEMERWHEIQEDREAALREQAEIEAEMQYLHETFGRAAWPPLYRD